MPKTAKLQAKLTQNAVKMSIIVNLNLVNLTVNKKYGSALALLRRTQRPLHGVKAEASRLRLLGEGLTAPRKLSTIKKRPGGAFVAYEGDYCGVKPTGLTGFPFTSAT